MVSTQLFNVSDLNNFNNSNVTHGVDNCWYHVSAHWKSFLTNNTNEQTLTDQCKSLGILVFFLLYVSLLCCLTFVFLFCDWMCRKICLWRCAVRSDMTPLTERHVQQENVYRLPCVTNNLDTGVKPCSDTRQLDELETVRAAGDYIWNVWNRCECFSRMSL